MNCETLKFVESGNIGTITLSRPEKRNAINYAMIEDLGECIKYCSENNDIRAVVLTGQGNAFCSGGDLLEIIPSKTKNLLNNLHPMLLDLRRLPKPIVAAVNGPATGGGFALALSCDIIIAGTSARFNAQWVRIALSTDCGASYMLPRLMGDKRAAWLLFTGEVVDAQRGYELGFVNKVVEDDQLLTETNGIAKRLAESATTAIANIKRLLDLSWHEKIESQMEYEKELLSYATLTLDHDEALMAFREKRRPKFQGR